MKVLSIFAHPDDETMLAGGTLALLARQGAQVDYLCATRGEGGELGDPPLCAREDAGRVRSAELACAVRALGGDRLSFLDYIDPLVGPEDKLFPFTDDEDRLLSELRETISQGSYDLILTHGTNGEYGHPAHLLVNRAVLRAGNDMAENAPFVYTVQAAFDDHPKPRLMNKDDPADVILDVRLVKDQKIQAALCHRTQNALFVRRGSEQAGRKLTVPEVIVLIESLHRALPVHHEHGEDPIISILLDSGCIVS